MSNSPGLIQALIQKMDWHGQRQKVLADNIANADTPDYQPKDLVPMDFKAVLKDSSTRSSAKSAGGRILTTNPVHIGAQSGPAHADAKSRTQKKVYEVAPAGNAVVLEEQMLKVSENVMDYEMTSNTYRKFMTLLRTALGRGGQG